MVRQPGGAELKELAQRLLEALRIRTLPVGMAVGYGDKRR